jgi:dihydroorotate dehydrogenase
MIDLYPLLGPVLRALPPETAHRVSIRALACGLVPRARGADDPVLAVALWGRRLSNPVGVAAGFDKGAEVPEALLGLGFGLVEIGTVTPRPQPGNPRPRLFRLPEDRAVINRFGFNSEGLAVAAARMARVPREGRRGLIGANVGKNKDSETAGPDYAAGVRTLAPHADYLVVNVSSPNTPGLRELQRREALLALLAEVEAALAESVRTSGVGRPPLLIKVAPDLAPAEREDLAAALRDIPGVDGVIIGNTTLSRPAGLRGARRAETGGLSGKPLMPLSTEVLADLYRLTGGRVPLIGCGGISSGADAYEKIRAGATLVQLYTALVYEGPALIGRIKRDLAALLRRDGFNSVTTAVGSGHKGR